MKRPRFRRSGLWLGAVLASFGCRSEHAGRAPSPSSGTARGAIAAPAGGAATSSRHPEATATVEVGFGDRTLRTDVVSTFAGRARGYMDRSRVADDEALLFVYASKDGRSFWMKNCLISLDILYLDDDGTVLDVLTAAPPPAGTADEDQPRFPSSFPVRLVLETRAGLAREAGVKTGDRVRLPAAFGGRFASADS